MVRKLKNRNISSFDGGFGISESRGKKDQYSRFSLNIYAAPKKTSAFLTTFKSFWFFFERELQ
jgi:hypothetical protein